MFDLDNIIYGKAAYFVMRIDSIDTDYIFYV